MELKRACVLSMFTHMTQHGGLGRCTVYGDAVQSFRLLDESMHVEFYTHTHFKKCAQTNIPAFNVVTHTDDTHSTRWKHALSRTTVMYSHAYNQFPNGTGHVLCSLCDLDTSIYLWPCCKNTLPSNLLKSVTF